MRIVYNSFDGRYSDSPRALHEALLRSTDSSTGALEHTWLAHPDHLDGFPAGTTLVSPTGPDAVAALEAADLVVSNTHVQPQWTKRPGCLYLQTWHGTPLKRIAADEPHVGADDPVPGWRDIDRWDLLLSSGPAATRALTSGFRWTGPVAETGWPRNDALVAPTAAAQRERVRAELGLLEGDTAVLYTPTWRDDVLDAQGRRDVVLQLDLDDLSRRRPPGTVLLLRLHYMLSGRLAEHLEQTGGALPEGVLDVSGHPDIAELYLAADAMVTDYSSTLFDFAATRKPVALFAYDLEHYRDDLRGFTFDLFSAPPGPVLRTSTELVDWVVALATDPAGTAAPFAGAAAAFLAEHCPLDDGGATRRVLDLVLPRATSDRASRSTTRPTDLEELVSP